jgi:hypothetical protein
VSTPQADTLPISHIAELGQLVRPKNGFHVEPRCRVCRNPKLCRKVNDLLASGATYGTVLRAVASDNESLEKRDRVTIDSIRNHSARHFPVQNAARATYRAILEQRARENGVDFVNGVATAITPMAVYETIMVRGYETIVDPDTKIDVNTAMIAAGRVHALSDTRAGQPDIVTMRAEMNRIIYAVKSTVPESMWPEIARKLEGEAIEPIAEDADAFDPEDDAYGDEEPEE